MHLTQWLSCTQVQSVIRGMRRFNKQIAVFHWCLDTYPTLASVAAIDVDSFLTNSRLLALHGFTMAGGNVLGLASPWFHKAVGDSART